MPWRALRGVIAVGITIGCIFLLLPSVQLPALAEEARQADLGLIGLAVALIIGSLICKAVRWWILYPTWCRPSFRLAVAALVVGQAINWLLPARLGEAVRLGMVGTDGRSVEVGSNTAVGIGVLIAEKMFDAVMLVIAVIVLAWLGAVPGWLRTVVFLVSGGAGVLGVALALIARDRAGALRPRWRGDRWASPWLQARVATIARYVRIIGVGFTSWLNRKDLSLVVPASLGAWVLGGATNYLVLRSLGLDVGIVAAVAVLVALYGGATIPSLPGRIGVFQYLCVLALAPFGVPLTRALAFSVVLYAVVYLPPLALGLVVSLILNPIAFDRPTRALRRAAMGVGVITRPP